MVHSRKNPLAEKKEKGKRVNYHPVRKKRVRDYVEEEGGPYHLL